MSFLRWFRDRHSRERDLDDEIAAHLRMAAQDLRDRGQAPAEAAHSALSEFGNEALIKETTRDMWAWRALDSLSADLRYAFRIIAKSKAWALAVIVSFALGIGANAAIFSLTYAVVLRSLPVPNPGQLIRYSFRNGAQDIGLSGPAYDAIRRHQTVATDVLASAVRDMQIDEGGTMQPIVAAMMSGNAFRVLEVEPVLGRAFSPADDVQDGGSGGFQALLSNKYWMRRYNGSPDVLGRKLILNGRLVTIIGVLPPGFAGVEAASPADLFVPLSFEAIVHAPHPARTFAGAMWLTVIGRLKAGESLESARANMKAVAQLVRDEADPTHQFLDGFFKPFRFGVEDGRGGRSFLRSTYGQPLLVLEMLVGALLLLCCANTALLVFAHVSGRVREFALRSALGADRLRLVRQVVFEVCLLSVPGLMAAVALGWWLARALVAMLSAGGPDQLVDVTPNLTTMMFTMAVTLLSAMAAALWPAIRAGRVNPAANLGGRQQLSSTRNTGTWIIPAQVAASVTLVASAVLLGSTIVHLYLEPSGFHASQTTLADVNLGAAKLSDQRLGVALQQITGRLTRAPGIVAAAAMSVPPLHDWWSAGAYESIDRHGNIHSDQQTWPESVTEQYFDVMGTRIIAGRPFEQSDLAESCVVVLGASTARYFFPGDDPIGQSLYSATGDPKTDKGLMTPKNACRIIGVAEDVRFRSLREAPPRMLYKVVNASVLGTQFTIAVRSSGAALATSIIRESVRAAVPAAPAPRTLTMPAVIDSHLKKERMLIGLSGSFALIALVLTAFGLFGLLTRSVVERTAEIGIRMALGAPRHRLLGSVLRRAGVEVLIGLAIGTAIAIAATRGLSSLLYGAHPEDAWVYLASAAVILLVGTGAALIPARRAVSIDPMQALRAE